MITKDDFENGDFNSDSAAIWMKMRWKVTGSISPPGFTKPAAISSEGNC